MKKSISAYDVAKLAKVSQSTVSRVLNNYPYVKQTTRDRVHGAIKELGFSPNEIARSLAIKKTNTIGLIVEDISSAFYSETAHIILREAQKYDYEVIIVDSDTDDENFSKSINTLLGKRVDGIIVASVRLDNKKINDFFESGFPVVTYNRRAYETENSKYVVVDNKKGAMDAMNYLFELKHRKIAFISGPLTYSTFHERYEGYKEALRNNGIEYDETIVYKDVLSYDKVFEFALDLMRKPYAPTAFFASTDQMALALMDAASRSGRHIPYDISVIGFDDINISSNPYIGLSTVSQQKETMAVKALENLMFQIARKDENSGSNKIVIDSKLVTRKTTGINNH